MASKGLKWWLGLMVISLLVWVFNWKLPFTWFNSWRQWAYQRTVKPSSNEVATAETATLAAEIIKLKAENERLRTLLGAPLPASWQFVPASALKLEADLMTINVGVADRVTTGQTVIGYIKETLNNGVVLGTVVGVDAHQTLVKLIFSQDLSIKAVTESGASGLVEGDGESAWLTQVRQADRLSEGELIVTVGGDGWLPGLVLGRVGEVIKEDTAVFQTAKVALVIDPRAVVNVWVVSD